MNLKRSFLDTSWWQIIKKEIETELAEVETEILNKAIDPVNNQTFLLEKAAKRECYQWLLSLPISLIEEAEEQNLED